MTDPNDEYRACGEAIKAARVAWADAERCWYADPSPANAAEMQARFDDVQFCKAARVAAGEAVKVEDFATVLERNEAHRPTQILDRLER